MEGESAISAAYTDIWEAT